MVFYKSLFKQREKITGSMAILYSMLLGHSLMSNGELFDHNGNFNYENAREFIDEETDGGFYYIDYYPLPISYLSKQTGMTPQNVRLTLKRLDEQGLIGVRQESICCPLGLLDEGFIKIPTGTKLKGWQLIDYAFMKHRATNYNNTIDTWAINLCKMLHTTQDNVYKTIERLKAKGYAQRLPNGKLLIK